MFSIDFWQEILYTIKTNKLRTGLTGFSVAWGIFILILLLGTGNGLQNGVRAQFSRGAVNSMWISSFRTSRPYNGLPEGRPIVFHNDDYEALKKIKEIEAITGRYDEDAWGERSVMQYKENYGVFEMCSCHPDQAIADQIDMDQGRFVNQIDIEQIRKTAAITHVVKEALFKNEDPLGKYISVRGVPFKVVGVFRDASELNSRRIYIPITTRQRVFNGGNRIAFFGITVIDMTSDRIGKTETAIREYFAKKYNFDPQDARAIHINDVFKEYKKYMDLFSTLRMAVWIAGIMTIIAGIMGVGNIMVTVKARTHEIGIRRVLGATPITVITQILMESVLLTAGAGIFGLGLGILVVSAFSGVESPTFRHPEIATASALSSLGIIIVSGLAAGLLPAYRAVSLKPIEALRDIA